MLYQKRIYPATKPSSLVKTVVLVVVQRLVVTARSFKEVFYPDEFSSLVCF